MQLSLLSLFVGINAAPLSTCSSFGARYSYINLYIPILLPYHILPQEGETYRQTKQRAIKNLKIIKHIEG